MGAGAGGGAGPNARSGRAGWRAAIGIAVIAVLAVACGGDDDVEDTGDPDAAPSASTTTVVTGTTSTTASVGDGSEPSSDTDAAGSLAADFATDFLCVTWSEVIATPGLTLEQADLAHGALSDLPPPPELESSVDLLKDAIRSFISDPDTNEGALSGPDWDAAFAEVDAVLAEHCVETSAPSAPAGSAESRYQALQQSDFPPVDLGPLFGEAQLMVLPEQQPFDAEACGGIVGFNHGTPPADFLSVSIQIGPCKPSDISAAFKGATGADPTETPTTKADATACGPLDAIAYVCLGHIDDVLILASSERAAAEQGYENDVVATQLVDIAIDHLATVG